MPTRATLAKDFWDRPLRDLFQTLEATPAGLTSDEANRRLRLYGPNSFVKESRFATLFSFLRLVANPLVIILLIASGASLALGDRIGGLIIISIVLLSVLLNFFMEFQARHAVEKISKTGRHDCCRYSGWARAGTSNSGTGSRRHHPAECWRPCAGGCSAAQVNRPAGARVSAHWRVSARREVSG